MQEIRGVELPLYRVKCYGDMLYRVTKRLFSASSSLSKAEAQEYDAKLSNALSRARCAAREYALCNKWEYFVTLTIDGQRWNRYSFKDFLKEFMQWIQNENKKGAHIRYILVPEFHKDGAVHLHGLMSGITEAPQLPGTPLSVGRRDDGSRYPCWPAYSLRYGFSTVERVRDLVAVGFYITKYMTKAMSDLAAFKGVHTYYHSRGLSRALVVGSLFSTSIVLDKCCKFQNNFYSFGFFKADICDVVGMCDEVDMMYQNYLITDPVSGELVAMVGGDDQDVEVQLMLEEFKTLGLCCSQWDFPD